MTMLSCQGLEVDIAGHLVVQRLELEVRPGQFWGLMGANGIGKTTLMRCLAGLAPGKQGHVCLDGQPIRGLPRREVAQRLGMLQQHTAYVFDASVLQTALTGRHPHLGPWQRESTLDIDKARDAIASVRERRRLVLPGLPFEDIHPAEGTLALLSAEGQFGFRSTVVPLDDEGSPLVSKACREALGVTAGDEVLVTPLP